MACIPSHVRWRCTPKLAVRVAYLILILGMLACGLSGVVGVWNTMSTAKKLEDDNLPVLELALRLKWLNYRLLELATRSIERHDLFFSLYSSSLADLNTELVWMLDKVDSMGRDDWKANLERVDTLVKERILDDRHAIDGASCTQWGTFNCEVQVPGVASNADITITITDGAAACDVVDSVGGGICEWMPDRPDEVPEPQPLNLLNKCVCYACKGPLPDLGSAMNDSVFSWPRAYQASEKGTDGKYQCENDPRYAGKCYWDGLNCVPHEPLPQASILNSTEYMDRFDEVVQLLATIELAVHGDMVDEIESLMGLSHLGTVYTCVVAILYTAMVIGFMLLHLRPRRKYSLGFAFFTMTTLFLITGWAFFIFVVYTSTHMHELWQNLRDTELVIYRRAWDIIYYDSILTTSASRFVMTAHNSGWVDEAYTGVAGGVRVYDHWFIKYIETVGSLDAAINYAVEHAESTEEQRIFNTIDTVNKMLVDLEQISLCSCEPPDASALAANDTTLGVTSLYSTTYLQAKETYNSQNKNFLNVQMQRLLVRVRELQSKAELMSIMMLSMVFFIPMSLTEMFRQIIAKKAQRRAEFEHRQTRIKNVLRNTIGLFAHPLVAIKASLFTQLGIMVKHEAARKKNLLSCFDSPMQATNHFILFISHQWLDTAHPDPGSVQYCAVCSAIRKIADQHQVKLSEMYIWLDYHSIPQFNAVSVGVGVSAIASLVNYAMYSTAMCVVAPAATHASGYVCNFGTYMSRGWCRAEQAGYMLKNGTKNLYIMDETGFRAPDPQSLENYEAFFPMEGTFTCCKWQHKGGALCDREHLVDVMIYLYYSAKGLEGLEDSTFVYNFVMKNRSRIFPRKFLKTGDGGTTRSKLFGTLLEELDKMMMGDNELSTKISNSRLLQQQEDAEEDPLTPSSIPVWWATV
mmetsp:Transcript_4239/g.9219  ORF Transcript_4239/g.9219 Transcript_4239/m.9219 type:complete len:918 (+) Transcript_4239:90-2843(+)